MSIITQLQQCTNQLMNLPLDLIGRVNMLKIIFLSKLTKLLYVMANALCKILKSPFKQIDSLCMGFIWNRHTLKLAL